MTAHWKEDAACSKARLAAIDGIRRFEESGGAPVETMELFGTINGEGDNLLDAALAAVYACGQRHPEPPTAAPSEVSHTARPTPDVHAGVPVGTGAAHLTNAEAVAAPPLPSPGGEPVAWRYRFRLDREGDWRLSVNDPSVVAYSSGEVPEIVQPLYRRPLPAPTRGVTQEQELQRALDRVRMNLAQDAGLAVGDASGVLARFDEWRAREYPNAAPPVSGDADTQRLLAEYRTLVPLAKSCGFLLSVYGSTLTGANPRDLDLIAVAWRPEAVPGLLFVAFGEAGWTIQNQEVSAMGAVCAQFTKDGLIADLQVRLTDQRWIDHRAIDAARAPATEGT